MTFRRPLSLLLMIGLSLAAGEMSSRAADSFLAGAATSDLTPRPGVSLNGAISKPGPMTGVHDPLTARALMLKQGTMSVVIVVCDMCMIDRDVMDRAKRIAAERTGIPSSRMLIASTHSHATPRVMRISQSPENRAYRGLVAERIAAAIVKAQRQLAPAVVGFGTFDKPNMTSCRRFLCEPGSVDANPFGEQGEQIKSVAGKSAGILRAAGPTDPQVSVLSIRHSDGTPLAVLANFSVHYCGGYQRGLVSADYFGAFAEHLAKRLAEDNPSHPPFVGIMSNGTSGDTGALQVPNRSRQPWANIQTAGSILAESVADLTNQLTYQEPDILRMKQAELELGIRKPSAERLAWAEELLADQQAKGPHPWSRIYARETLFLKDFPDRKTIILQAVRIGDVCIAACPCEVFAETGLAIKDQSPARQTFTIELANGYAGYLPTPEQHRLGGYETWAARTSHLEVEAEPKIRQQLLKLLEEVNR